MTDVPATPPAPIKTPCIKVCVVDGESGLCLGCYRRLSEVASRGGGLVVTSCATCTFMLKRNAPRGVEVADLPTAVAQLTGTPVIAPVVNDAGEDAEA